MRPFSLSSLTTGNTHRQRHQWRLIEILQRERRREIEWEGGKKKKKINKQTEKVMLEETEVRKNCRKPLGHPVPDLGKWQHTEQMKTGPTVRQRWKRPFSPQP